MQPPETHPGRHLVNGTVRVLLAEAVFPLTGLITAAFLTRRLGPAGYGLFTLVATVVTWVEGSLVTVFARATFKFVAEAEDWRPIGTTSGYCLLPVWLPGQPLK
jgi:O-antigen/teichoic acid export membrane protein